MRPNPRSHQALAAEDHLDADAGEALDTVTRGEAIPTGPIAYLLSDSPYKTNGGGGAKTISPPAGHLESAIDGGGDAQRGVPLRAAAADVAGKREAGVRGGGLRVG